MKTTVVARIFVGDFDWQVFVKPRQVLDGDNSSIQVDVRVSDCRSDVTVAGQFHGVYNAGAVGQQASDVGDYADPGPLFTIEFLDLDSAISCEFYELLNVFGGNSTPLNR